MNELLEEISLALQFYSFIPFQVYEAAVSIAEYVNEMSWLRRHVGEYARSSDFSLTNQNPASLASGSDVTAAGSKQDSLMVLRC